MDNRRLFLLGALGLIGYLIFNAWMHDYGPQRPAAPPATTSASAAPAPVSSGIPQAAAPGAASTSAPANAAGATSAPAQPSPAEPVALAQGEPITVTTDTLRVTLNTAGGAIREVELLDYPQSKDRPHQPVHLLQAAPAGRLVLQSGLRGVALPSHQATYRTARDHYVLPAGADAIKVPLTWRHDGVTVTKTYTFHRGSYQVGLDYRIDNRSAAAITGAPYSQFRRHYVPQSHHYLDASRYTYSGPAMYTGTDYRKLSYDDLNDKNVSLTAIGGWEALVSQYFVAAVIPPARATVNYYARSLGGAHYLVGLVMPQFKVAAGAQATLRERLFFGPKLQDRLTDVVPGLERTIDYGKFTIIAQPLFWVLKGIHWGVGNWGLSIILLVFLIKAVFFPLNQMSGRSMAKMREFQPRIKAIQERYKDDKSRLSQAMMELYKKEKINPMGGCLPMLLQVPIWFALYYVLLYSVELRQAPFVFWLQDLASPDPYYVLPILYAIAGFFQQRVNPQPGDKMQARIMMAMPVMMMAFAVFMPAGLVIYWVTNAILTALQQWHINRVIHQPKRVRR